MEISMKVLADSKPPYVVLAVRYFDDKGNRLKEPKDVIREAVFEGTYQQCEAHWLELQQSGTEACEALFGKQSHYRVAVSTCDAPYHGLALSEAA